MSASEHLSESAPEPQEMPFLGAHEFPLFFEAVTGVPPFPWQTRLNHVVAGTGAWPPQLSLPPASGKSTLIIVAVFHLALEASRGAQRRAPLRIVHATDRRLMLNAVVDWAQHLERLLADALRRPPDISDILARVARRLGHLARGPRPLMACGLEAGIVGEGDWTPTPHQPTILCTSVDHLGSRLLFRGYGINPSMLPVQAGLLGADCLIILDDPQRCEAFRQTLAAIEHYRRPPWCEVASPPWQYLTLWSTASPLRGEQFTLTDEDRDDPVLGPRLRAAKPVDLASARVPALDLLAHARFLVREVSQATPCDVPPVVGLIVNTVALARACYELLEQRSGAKSDIILLLGRNRAHERQRLLARIGPLLKSGRVAPRRPLYLVATQCIEVGADIDLDILVTQIAPLDTLRVRFGRLNRLGRNPGARGIIAASSHELRDDACDPQYGPKLKPTWDWLWHCQHGAVEAAESDEPVKPVDFGTLAMEARFKDADPSPLLCESPNAPRLPHEHLDLLSQTTPQPTSSPDVGPLLYGEGVAESGDVQVIWRPDVDLTTADRVRYSIAALATTPPHVFEGIALPLAVARAWLDTLPIPPFGDLEGGNLGPVSKEPKHFPPTRRAALRWRGLEEAETGKIYSWDLRAGDVIVVPSSYGGADQLGWTGLRDLSGPPVADISSRSPNRAALQSPIVRLDYAGLQAQIASHSPKQREPAADLLWTDVLAVTRGSSTTAAEIANRLAYLTGLPPSWKRRLKQLGNIHSVTMVVHSPGQPNDRVAIVFADPTAVCDGQLSVTASHPSTTEFRQPRWRKQAWTLEWYAKQLERRAGESARALSFDVLAVDDLELAAALASEGKRDPRYQAYLRGGDWIALHDTQVPIVTLRVSFQSLSAAADARQRVGLPDRWCPEAAAVTHALQHPRLPMAHDKDLVLYLVGTHRGAGRPLYPHCDPALPGPQEMGWSMGETDWSTNIATVRNRYGWWGLAYRESVLRLAEHRIGS